MRVELLSSVLWRGVVNPGGTVLELPSETAERLIEAGVAKAEAKAAKSSEDKPALAPKRVAKKKATRKKKSTNE